MNWFDWFLIAWIALGGIATVACVGREREPITPLSAVSAMVVNTFLIVGIIIF